MRMLSLICLSYSTRRGSACAFPSLLGVVPSTVAMARVCYVWCAPTLSFCIYQFSFLLAFVHASSPLFTRFALMFTILFAFILLCFCILHTVAPFDLNILHFRFASVVSPSFFLFHSLSTIPTPIPGFQSIALINCVCLASSEHRLFRHALECQGGGQADLLPLSFVLLLQPK